MGLWLVSSCHEVSCVEKIQSLGFSVSIGQDACSDSFCLVEALSGADAAKVFLGGNIAPARSIAVCSDPSGLPAGCLWLHPTTLDSGRAAPLLQAWMADSKEDPMRKLLAQISHDMRSPLSVISTAASLIPKFSQNEKKLARYLGLINESSGVLKSLVNDILDYSRISEGQFSFTASNFNLSQLLSSVTEGFEILVKDPQRLEVSWRPKGELPEFVYQDPGRLRQILMNLMNNALKFTNVGFVHLTASWADGMGRFEIADSGVGIKKAALERIFQPYQQADESIHAAFGGTGLGLTICRALAGHMGGEIGVESKFGEGSTFWFTASLPEIVSTQPESLPLVYDSHILIASLSPGFLLDALGDGDNILLCRSKQDLEQHFVQDNDDVELYLVDLGVGGFDLIAELMKKHPRSKVVVVTSVGQRGDVALCKEMGVRGYLTLPMDRKELMIAVALTLSSDSKDIITRYSAKEYIAAHQ